MENDFVELLYIRQSIIDTFFNLPTSFSQSASRCIRKKKETWRLFIYARVRIESDERTAIGKTGRSREFVELAGDADAQGDRSGATHRECSQMAGDARKADVALSFGNDSIIYAATR